MREFFQGWRRKVGCGFLIIALLFAGGWMRSLTTRDTIAWTFRKSSSGFRLRSANGSVGWQRWTWRQIEDDGWTSDNNFREDNRFGGDFFNVWYQVDNVNENPFKWRQEWAGFDFRSATWIDKFRPELKSSVSVCILPYWSLTLLLTLFSAYLLFWKPRKQKPARTENGDKP